MSSTQQATWTCPRSAASHGPLYDAVICEPQRERTELMTYKYCYNWTCTRKLVFDIYSFEGHALEDRELVN